MEKERYYQIAIVLLAFGLVFALYQNQQTAASIEAINNSQQDRQPDEDRNERVQAPQRIDLDGPFYAEQNRGLIAPGSTEMALTIQPTLTGPMEITFTAGRYTDSQGQSYQLEAPKSFTIEPHSDLNKTIAFFLTAEGTTLDVEQDSYLISSGNMSEGDVKQLYGNESTDISRPDNVVQTLIGYRWLVVSPGETTLQDNSIPVFYVWRPDNE